MTQGRQLGTTWRRAVHVLADFLGKLWASPNTVAGLLLGGLSMAAGARPQLAHNAVVFNRAPLVKRAFTLGNVIVNPGRDLGGMCPTYASAAAYRNARDPRALQFVSLGAHEEAHTLQYQLLGPFFLPLYALTQLLPSPTPFERAADIYAKTGRGWWPAWHNEAKIRLAA
jgi:hypothetical protein